MTIYFFSYLFSQKRHISDNAVNNRKANILCDGQQKTDKWSSVEVGEILRLENNEQVPVSAYFFKMKIFIVIMV